MRMKSLMILGAIVGFLIGGGFSLIGGCSWPTTLWRACAAALAAAVLARWWSRLWLINLSETVKQRRRPPKTEIKSTLKPTAKL
jgi:MFS family permease